MKTITEALQSSVQFEIHMEAHEKAIKYLICIKKAKIRASIKLHDANNQLYSTQFRAKCLKRWASANAAKKKLEKSYQRQLFNLFYKSKF